MESEGISAPDSVGPESSKARRLKSPFPEFEPIRVKFCQVQGIVRGVVRRY